MKDIIRIVLVLDHLETSEPGTVHVSDPITLFFRKKLNVRAATDHVRSWCVEEERTHPDDGSGLVGLIDRVEALGGTILIDSPPRRGTRIEVDLPTDLGDGSSVSLPPDATNGY